MKRLLALSKLSVLVVLALGVVGFGGVLHSQDANAATKSFNWVDRNLKHGIQTAYNWDNGCRQSLRVTNPMVRDTTFAGGLRAYFNEAFEGNQAISYRTDAWVSLAEQGNITSPIIVREGDTSVDFQVNFVMFLCGNLVSPDLTNGCTSGLGSITGQTIANDNQRWVPNPAQRNANDRAPNPFGSRCMSPTRTNNASWLDKIEVFERRPDGSWSDNPNQTISINAYRETPRQNDSRYWNMPVIPFEYNRPGGFTEPVQLRFKLFTKEAAVYGNASMVYYDNDGNRVPSGGTPNPYPGLNNVPWNDIRYRENTYSLSVDVEPRPRVTPVVSIDKTTLVDGEQLTSQHNITKTTSDSTEIRIRKGFFHDANRNGTRQAGEAEFDVVTRNETITSDFNFGTSSRTIDANDFPSGRVCAFTEILSANPAVITTPIDIECAEIGKRPHMHISGGDLVVRGIGQPVQAPATTIGGRKFGTWTEYGAFAAGSANIHSGGSLIALTNPGNNNTQQNALTFANTPAAGNFGDMGSAPAITLPNYQQVTAGGTITLSSLQNNRHYHRSGNINLTNSNNSQFGRSTIIESNSQITISNNIRYANGDYQSINELPQLIIRAPRIIIASGVSRVDAWLITTGNGGRVVTCNQNYSPGSPYFQGLNIDRCDTSLTINGPVSTDSLYLRRTAGASGTTPESRRAPAEAFNLRSDAYLWSYGQAVGSGSSIRTESVKDLSPRF